jgi:putative Holliday junction resolvase
VRSGRRLGFDVGQARTGVAVSSDDGIFASPIGNITSPEAALDLVAEYSPIELYVGLPLSLSGSSTKSTEHALEFATKLSELTSLSVLMIDERLTTNTAQSLMRAAGKSAKKARPGIDAAAATLILEQALALERAGNAPGKRIEECK